MRRLYICVAEQHDSALVALAGLICLLGAVASVVLCRHAAERPAGGARAVWIIAAATATSASIWATHFIAMLAFEPGMPWAILPGPTFASLAGALLLVLCGTTLIVDGRGMVAWALGGLVIGLTVPAMHYLGMAGYRVTGLLSWDTAGVGTSIAIGAVLGTASGATSRWRGRGRVAGPALLLMLAVVGTHFAGMSAMTAVVDPGFALPTGAVPVLVLSVLVGHVTLLILGLMLLAHRLHLRLDTRIRDERQRICDLADIALEGLVILNGGRVIAISRSLARLLPAPRESYFGATLDALLPGCALADVPHDQEAEAFVQLGAEAAPVRVIAQTVMLGRQLHTVVAVRDQRERLRSEAEVRRLAFTDSLTGLPNRARYNTILEARCKTRRAADDSFALLALDLDRFKAVNDMFGHGAGDSVLAAVAGRLRAVLREGDFIARLGGDEFALIAEDVNTADQLQILAERVVDLLSRPYLINAQVYDIGVSVGVALYPGDGDDPATLGRHADLALLRAKDDGRGTYRLFEQEMDARMHARRHLEAALRRATLRQDFVLHYQPQVDAKTGRYNGAEALVRWTEPDRGLVPPGEFIPIAEETGLIVAIGEWVLRTACRDALDWPEELRVAVNLSPVQVRDPGLADMVAGVLQDTGLPATRLELEITESVIMHNADTTLATLNRLREMGIRISLDDFGTGYSSLSYLRQFPFDKIKIDQSFVRQTPDDPESAAILRAIVLLGTSLGMATTAEGVETQAQMRFVTGEGCTQAQGYLISRPVPQDMLMATFALDKVAA